MNQKICFIAIFWFFLCTFTAPGQDKKDPQQDSAKIYREIEQISKQNKYFRFVHSLIFKPVTSSKKSKKKVLKEPDTNFDKAERKPVRNIEITTLDPFGLNIKDTSVKAKGFLPKTGNALHIKSGRITIRNLLLFKKDDLFDSLTVKESERLIRSQNYIREVISEVRFNGTRDSVDVVFFVQDLWSIEAGGNLSTTSFGLDVSDKNFMGLGHQLQQAISKESKKEYAFETNYYIRNIRNTFISSNIHYRINADNSYLKRFLTERPFYSSFARWAGGILFDQQFKTDSILFIEDVYKLQRIKFNTQDFWLGKSWNVSFDKSAYSRATNLIVTGRFMRVNYLEKPDSALIPTYTFAQEKLFLFSAGISTRLYVQDKYIFKYGLTEDIPRGKIFSFTTGYQMKNSVPRLYTGFKISWADYFDLGYFNNNIEYGTFFRKGRPEQGSIRLGISYFTGLLPIGRWNIRQFIKPTIILGLHRYKTDRIFIKPDSITSSIHFYQNDEEWSGAHRLSLTLQTQSYAPWQFYGFRFGPYFSISMALLTQKNITLQSSRLFAQFDLGILVKNEFLLFNYFQFSISFIPVLPGGKNNSLKANAYKTSDFGMPDFDTGRPTVTVYQ